MGCNSAFITLIPKSKDPGSLNDYRPITLVGIVNKVVSKVLANRLKRVLAPLISVNQSAFLADRSIMDGPLIVNELVEWWKKSKSKAFLFKVDFNKAYDNVNWAFLMSIMTQMGFPARWCNWIYSSLASAKASVLVNGSTTEEFQCFKGMRQGDPLSPFLFLIVMEALSNILKKASSGGLMRGVSLPNNGPVLSHLLYADDVLFLGEWSRYNIKAVSRFLRCFHLISGLKINLNKSTLCIHTT